MPARKKLPPAIPRKVKAPAHIIVLGPRRDAAWGRYCLWPRHVPSVTTLPVIRIERY